MNGNAAAIAKCRAQRKAGSAALADNCGGFVGCKKCFLPRSIRFGAQFPLQ
jgi:hypothetical protein